MYSSWFKLLAIPTIELGINVFFPRFRTFDFKFVGDGSTVFGVALNGRFLSLCLNRPAQSYTATRGNNLDVFGHHREGIISNDHPANLGGNPDIGRIID